MAVEWDISGGVGHKRWCSPAAQILIPGSCRSPWGALAPPPTPHQPSLYSLSLVCRAKTGPVQMRPLRGLYVQGGLGQPLAEHARKAPGALPAGRPRSET